MECCRVSLDGVAVDVVTGYVSARLNRARHWSRVKEETSRTEFRKGSVINFSPLRISGTVMIVELIITSVKVKLKMLLLGFWLWDWR